MERNSLIGATGYYYVLSIPHQPTNELVSRDGFGFDLHDSYNARQLPIEGFEIFEQ
jgi:hypothetical protein